jgi:hypothetical protein
MLNYVFQRHMHKVCTFKRTECCGVRDTERERVVVVVVVVVVVSSSSSSSSVLCTFVSIPVVLVNCKVKPLLSGCA